jgi:serine protease
MGMSAGMAGPLGLRAEPSRTSGGEFIYDLSQSTLLAAAAEGRAEATVLEVVEQLNQMDQVEYAQPNWILRHQLRETKILAGSSGPPPPNDPRFPEQWDFLNNGTGEGESPGGINLPKRWAKETGRAEVVVAVIDTGILPDHEDITGSPNLGTGHDFISSAFVANDGDGRDADPTDPGDGNETFECFALNGDPDPSPDSWHGTHVAGTVGVVNTNNSKGVAGANWDVTIVPVRVLGKCGGSTTDINDGIRWAAGLDVDGAPLNSKPAKVINLSLGGPVPCSASPSSQAAINDAVAAGATVVVAAGNDARDAAGDNPASCDNVITVAASDARGHLADRYSNFGNTVEIMGPGGDRQRDDNADGLPDGVLSTVKDGYALYNGTSMAAPHVAGVAALLLAAEPGLTPDQVLERLQEAAIPRDLSECPAPCGAGLLNADF